MDDITPKHNPLGLLRLAKQIAEAQESEACLVVLVHKNGEVWSDCCGVQASSVLWGIKYAEYELLRTVVQEE